MLTTPKHNLLNSLKLLQMSAKCMRTLLSGGLLTRFTRGTKLRRKEKQRLQIAQIHATLAVARLATAIAGTVANLSMDPMSNWNMFMHDQGNGWDQEMSMVLASAAALVATVCAEAALAVGAERSIVASSINMGLAAQSAGEILGLTAINAAATCLTGTSCLEVRRVANGYLSELKIILVKGIQLPSYSTEKLQEREVRISLKNDTLTLKLVKKLLRGTISTHKEYMITGTSDEVHNRGCCANCLGLCSITLSTTGGTLQLGFEDKIQYLHWRSTISHLLRIRDERKLIV